jgi:fibro-slime domain-containing protein
MARFVGMKKRGAAGRFPEVVRKNTGSVLLYLSFLGFSTSAQQYPDTLWVKATFYDFHSDRSNPEFEPNHNNPVLHRGMVDSTLSTDTVPVIGKTPYYSYYIHKWFKSWTPGDSTIPVYTDRIGTFGGIDTVDYDTAFKNIEIKDSLPFIHQENGIYRFDRSGSNGAPSFFWLDGKGFGAEVRGYDNNFSFSMKIHTYFTYKKGLSFDFAGDDDVWAFINNKLVMDLGGMHSTLRNTIYMDSIAAGYGLVEGNKYPFDLFYCERHSIFSTFLMTTNLFAPPSNLRLYPRPGAPDSTNVPLSNIDTLGAGEPFTVYAHVFDTLGWHPEWDSTVIWEITDPEGRVLLSSNSGPYVTLVPKKAFGSVTLKATYIPDDPLRSRATVSIDLYIGPGKPHHITVQNTDAIGDKTKEIDLDALTFSKDQDSAVLYAVIRDSLGNFIRFADKAVWQSSIPAVASVRAQTGMQQMGIITKASGGLTEIGVSETGVIPATVQITVNATNVKVDSAFTRDFDGDGYLDGIYVVFDSTVTLPGDFSGYNVKQGNVSFKVENVTSSNSSLKGKQFTLKLTEITEGELQTDWTPLLSILGIEQSTPVIDYQCNDGAGPVARKALYYPGNISGAGNGGTPDTINVIISEKVTWTPTVAPNTWTSNPDPNQAFKYYQGGSYKESAFTSMAILNDSTVRLLISNKVSVDAGKDSIQLVRSSSASSEVVDVFKNLPPENGRKALVEWGRLNIAFAPSSNPFVIGTPIPQIVSTYYAQVITKQNSISPGGSNIPSSSGVLVGIKIKGKPPIALPDGSYGLVKIYDAVGNLINTGLRVFKAQGTDYGIYWNGRNKNQRLVGTGTYLFLFSITDISGVTIKETFKIGVKR